VDDLVQKNTQNSSTTSFSNRPTQNLSGNNIGSMLGNRNRNESAPNQPSNFLDSQNGQSENPPIVPPRPDGKITNSGSISTRGNPPPIVPPRTFSTSIPTDDNPPPIVPRRPDNKLTNSSPGTNSTRGNPPPIVPPRTLPRTPNNPPNTPPSLPPSRFQSQTTSFSNSSNRDPPPLPTISPNISFDTPLYTPNTYKTEYVYEVNPIPEISGSDTIDLNDDFFDKLDPEAMLSDWLDVLDMSNTVSVSGSDAYEDIQVPHNSNVINSIEDFGDLDDILGSIDKLSLDLDS